MKRRHVSRSPRLENLEQRIVLGFVWNGPYDEAPPPVAPPPADCGCGGGGGGGGSIGIEKTKNQTNTGSSATANPVRHFDGAPIIFTDDLGGGASPFGFSWGHTRSWSGLNNSSPNGNGWAVGELPYVVVAGGTDGSTMPGGVLGDGALAGTENDLRLSVVSGGTSAYTFRVPTSGPYASFSPLGDQKIKLETTPDPTPALRLTDAQGNVLEFYDVRRDVNDKPLAGSMAANLPLKYGKFKSYTAADGSTQVVANYDSGGLVTSVTVSDSAGAVGRIVYSYATVTNDLVTAATATPPELLASVTLQRSDGAGGWRPVRRTLYTYYTGRKSNGSGGWTNDPNGRLGDLQLARVEDAVQSGGSVIWETVDNKYYRYYKFTGEVYSLNQDAAGPTNNSGTTGGPDPLQPGTWGYNPAAPTGYNARVSSGLKTVVEGTAFARLAAAVPDYLAASDEIIKTYVNHFFKYERWADHVGADGSPSNGSDPRNGNNSWDWRTGYRLGTRYRVIEEIAQESGCSTCTSGTGTYKHEYTSNYNTNGIGYQSIEYNTWRMKTTEYLPGDGALWGSHDRQVTYTNEVGQPLLSVFVAVDGSAKPVDIMSGFESSITVSATNHGFQTGDRVAISGVFPAYFNGVFTVTRTGDDSFHFIISETYYRGLDSGTPYINQTVGDETVPTTATKVVGEWATYYRYDDQGRLILTAESSAVSGYDDAYLDLLNNVDGNYAFLRDSTGLITTYEYYTTTTATDTAPGSVDGLLKAWYVQQGELGPPVVQQSWTYYARASGGATTHQIATDTVYGLDSGTALDFSDRDPRATTYTYTWFAGTNQISSVNVAHPVVGAAHNGPGSADVETTVLDIHGRPIWSRDAAGYIHYTAYDRLTGGVVKTIADVDTARTGDFAGLPSGWSTPSGGGLHLINAYQFDDLGRTVKAVDPDGRVTHWVYNDADHEVRVYRGWNATTHTTTGPIEVRREYRPLSGASSGELAVYYESLTSSAIPTYDPVTNAPTGREVLDETNIQSLTREITNNGGQIVDSLLYYSMSGIVYASATAYLGTASNDSASGNYHGTTYSYDHQGRVNRAVTPSGTIHRKVYDALGRVVGEWVGTNDAGATDVNPAGTGSPNNMVQTTGYQYDGGGVGDGNLTSKTQYPDGSPTANDRVTAYAYDWRNRLVATKEGVQSTEGADVQRRIVFLDFNNLGEVTAGSVYAADGVGVSATKPNLSERLAYTTYALDEMGRVYDETVHSLDQAGVVVSTDYLRTSTYYDRLGRVVAVQNPGGLVSKARYDGAGRLVVSAQVAAQTDEFGKIPWAAAMKLDGDRVLTETRTRYNGAGDPNQVTTLDREYDALASATGSLFAPGAPELGDLGFEAIALAPGTFAYSPSGSSWAFLGSSGVSANGSGFTAGNRNAPEGNRVAFILGPGAITQTSTGWLAGTHTITFKAAQRGNWIQGDQSFKIQVDGVDIATFTPTGGTDYQTFTTTFTLATAGKHTISFVGLDPTSNNTVFIDDIAITPIAFAPAMGDPGFEDVVLAPGSFAYGPSGSAWHTAGGAGVSTNDSLFTAGNSDALQGDQVLFIQSTGVASQLIHLEPGTYTISLLAAQRANVPSEQTIQFKVNGILVASFKPSGYDYEAFSATFTLAGAGTYGLSLSGTSTTGDHTAFVDAVSIAAGDARASHATYYYDAARRLIHAVDFGTNGGLPFVRPTAAALTRSDIALVTSYDYNDAGLVDQVTDPSGVKTRTLYDALGRAVEVVANADAIGVPTASTNNTTRYAYDGLDRVLTVTAVTPAGAPDQVTTYVYGVATATGSLVNSNGLLWKIVQPDASAVTYTYNALGEAVGATDANGTVHSYTYDVLGRQRSDAVVALGTGVDGAVRRVETDYDALGRAIRFTTYNAAAGGAIVNQVEREFNGFGQITAEYQKHGGAVDTETSPKIRYDYVMANGGSRLAKMTYPTESRFLVYQYSTGINDDISRLSAIIDSAVVGVAGGVVELYHYLGLDAIVRRDQPQIGEALTYIRQPGDAAAAGDDRYSGLDRFGRIIDQNWLRTSASAGGAAGTSSVRLQYQYDRAGNAVSRHDLIDAALSELYEYDPLDRLTSFQRGVPSAPPTLQQSWDLDALGNWEGVTTGGVTTNREFNVGNQTTAVSGGTAPTYDANGAATSKDGKEFAYDAWGRLASVKAAGGGSTLAVYTYDALGRRAVEHYPGVYTTHVYFTPDWRIVEERTNDGAHLTVLGATGQIILRDVYVGGEPNAGWRYYARQNANGDIVALVKGASPNAGAVLERYAYEPYGSMVVMNGAGAVLPGGTAHSWRFFFQGGRLDNVSGLYNFQRRDYGPASGVWMTRDPIGLLGGDPNLYRFVGNNPVKFTDPTGLSVWDSLFNWYYENNKPSKAKMSKEQQYNMLLQALRDSLEEIGGICALSTSPLGPPPLHLLNPPPTFHSINPPFLDPVVALTPPPLPLPFLGGGTYKPWPSGPGTVYPGRNEHGFYATHGFYEGPNSPSATGVGFPVHIYPLYWQEPILGQATTILHESYHALGYWAHKKGMDYADEWATQYMNLCIVSTKAWINFKRTRDSLILKGMIDK